MGVDVTSSETGPATLAAAFGKLNEELCKVVGLSSSVRCIGQELPVTPLEDENAICPELVFPALASGLLYHANQCMTLVEKLETMLREQGIKYGD